MNEKSYIDIVEQVRSAPCSIEISEGAKGPVWSIKIYADRDQLDTATDHAIAIDARLRDWRHALVRKGDYANAK